MDIEQLATSAIESSISKVDKLKAYVDSNDKAPSFDGYIGVFSSNDFSKNNFKRINIQIKGKKIKQIPKTPKYSISVADLNNYKNHSGAIFFVVYLNEIGETLGVFYASLLPFNINELLEFKVNKKTISVHLKKFPCENDEKFELLLNFYTDSQKQSSFVNLDPIDLEGLKKSGTLEALSFSYLSVSKDSRDKSVPFFLEGKELYIYAKTKGNPLPIPIQHIDRVEHISESETIEKPIFVGEEKFYEYYKVTRLKDTTIVNIGNSFTLTFKDNERKLNYAIKIKGTLNNRIIDFKFVIAFLRNNGFKFGKEIFPIKADEIENKEKYLNSLEEQFASCNELQKLLHILNVKKDLDLEKCSDEDFRKLDILTDAFLYNKLINFPESPPIVAKYRVSNLTFLLFFVQEENGIRILDFFQELGKVIIKDESNNRYEVSQFYTLSKELILDCDNVDYLNIVDDFKSKPLSSVLFEYANSVMLQMLLAYDECQDGELLNSINEFSNWLCEFPEYLSKDISRINQLQILARMRRLTIDEREEIINIYKYSKSDDLKIGCLLLMGEIDEATSLLNKLPEKTQNAFKTYPIWYFANNNNTL